MKTQGMRGILLLGHLVFSGYYMSIDAVKEASDNQTMDLVSG